MLEKMTENEKAVRTIRSILQIFLIVIIFFVIQYLSGILQPFVLAGLAALIFQPLVYKLGEKKVPSYLSLPLVAVITLGVIAIIGVVIGDTAIEVSKESDFLMGRLTEKIETILLWVGSTFGVQTDVKHLFDELLKYVNFDSISSAFGSVSGVVGDATANFIMFGLFFVMILGGLKYYKDYIRFIAGSKEKGDIWLNEYEKINIKIIRYLSTKAFVSLMTGLFAYIVCLIFDVRFAVFWGFLTFVFNFIPSIGSILSTVVTGLFFLIQCETIGDFVVFTGLLALIQLVLGNVVEPKMMSSRLSLNTPTVIFGLFFWKFLWGPIGMMLSVPLFVIMRIILEHIPSLSFLGRMMGSSSEVNPRGRRAKKKAKNKLKTISECSTTSEENTDKETSEK